MSTHTIYGCVKSDGTVEFSDSESGCDSATITGCLITDPTDANFGKVKITHDYPGCSTQYYACYDKTTGKFKVDIDDDCCVEMISGNCCGDDCSVMPKYLQVVFSGIDKCGNDDYYCSDICSPRKCCNDMNKTYILEWESGCTWACVNQYDAGDGCCSERVQVVFIAGGITLSATVVQGKGRMVARCFYHNKTGLNDDGCNLCDNLPEGFTNANSCSWPSETDCEFGENGTAIVSIV